jgi:hypothetical protein
MRSHTRAARFARRAASLVALTTLVFGALAGIVYSPAGADPIAFAIEEDDGCRLVELDVATGAVTPIGDFDVAACVSDLALAPDGTLYGLRQEGEEAGAVVVLVRFDTTTGVPEEVGTINGSPAGLEDGGITFDAAGQMFVHIVTNAPGCDFDFVCLYSVDPANPGGATFIGPVDEFQTEFFGLASSCGGTTVSVREEEGENGGGAATSGAWPFTAGETQAPAPTDTAPDAAAELEEPAGRVEAQILTTIDTSTGGNTDVGLVGPANFVDSVEFDATGALWGVGFSIDPVPRNVVYRIDLATGAATPAVDVADDATLTSLAIAHPCTTPAPLVLEPTFTG